MTSTSTLSNWARALMALHPTTRTTPATAPEKCYAPDTRPHDHDPRAPMYVRIPALLDEACPNCGAANTDTTVTVYRVADERGAGFECDGCALWFRLAQADQDRV